MVHTKLYRVTEGDHKGSFGIPLAKDSAGNVVIELKGSGIVTAIPPQHVEEVRPYTVLLEGQGFQSHFEADPNANLKVGDVLLFTEPYPMLATVKKLDTKSDSTKGRTLAKAFRLTNLEPVKVPA